MTAEDWKPSAAAVSDGLLPYQQEFVNAINRKEDRPEVSALSVGRGNGKTHLAGAMLARALRPSYDPLYVEGAESVLVSASRPMAALTLEAARQVIGEDPDFRWRADGCMHLKTRTRCRVLSSDSRRAYGLGAALNLAVLDEPGSFAPTSGERLWLALLGSLGKNSSARIVACGTLAPGAVGGWWQKFVEGGSAPGKHVQLIQGDEATWRDWKAVLKANPCTSINANLVRTLKREHAEALESDRAASNFLRFRMNINHPEALAAQPIITVDEFARICERPIPERVGRPIGAVDLGGGRSFSAACLLWPESNRVEVWAQAAGDRTLEVMEQEDQQPPDTYRAMVREGGLSISKDRAVPDVGELLERMWPLEPSVLLCDSFRADELRSVVAGRVAVKERARGGGETAGNIAALRARLLDFGAGIAPESRGLLSHGFRESSMVINAAGEVRIVKKSERRSRDDGLAALLLCAGFASRRPAQVAMRGAHISKSGEVTWL